MSFGLQMQPKGGRARWRARVEARGGGAVRAQLPDGRDADEVERAYQEGQRRRDQEALRSEMEIGSAGVGDGDGADSLVDDASMKTLREYIQVRVRCGGWNGACVE